MTQFQTVEKFKAFQFNVNSANDTEMHYLAELLTAVPGIPVSRVMRYRAGEGNANCLLITLHKEKAYVLEETDWLREDKDAGFGYSAITDDSLKKIAEVI